MSGAIPHTSASRGSCVGDGGVGGGVGSSSRRMVGGGVGSSSKRIAYGLGEEKWRFSGPVSKILESF